MKQPIIYKVKCKNEDFQVTEVPLIPTLLSKKLSRFTYLWVQKSGYTTFDALERIKDFFKLKFSDIASQGLKDEDAITEQLISVKKILKEKDVALFNKKHDTGKKYFRIKYIVGYGDEPIKERMLHGNSFRIVIRNLEKKTAEDLLNFITAHRHHYFINYYDNQRFGMAGGPYNTHFIGKAVVEGDWKKAFDHIKITNNVLPDIPKVIENVSDYKKFFKTINPKKIAFFVSSYNSFLWNNQVSLLIKKHTDSKKYYFEHVGDLYLPTTHSFQCPHIYEADGYEFVEDTFKGKKKINSRNVIVGTTIYAHDLESDELHKGKKKLTVSFFLPTGSYATMIIKQIFHRVKK